MTLLPHWPYWSHKLFASLVWSLTSTPHQKKSRGLSTSGQKSIPAANNRHLQATKSMVVVMMMTMTLVVMMMDEPSGSSSSHE